MICYLTGMEPYYLKCIKDGPFQQKTTEGNAKPESQWNPDERRVVVQDQRLKNIIMSCLPDDIMESVISCVSAKETWTDLVHSFEGPLDTKENRIMDMKLEYQTFRAKSTESLSQTYTHYKTLLNELANDGVNLSKHKISVGFMNSLPEKWLTFSQGLRNANHTQTLDLADIDRRFQVTPKVSHLHAVKRIFRYLKGQPKLGLWYPKDSPFVLEAYTDSDYAGENLDRKSTTGGCQFLGRRLISWQCKKQTVVANSTAEA
ncbi:hypothetical protein Tco_0175430 [Tanacetum coccineum]